jgi:hypothetical protein
MYDYMNDINYSKPIISFKPGLLGKAGISVDVWAKDTWGFSIRMSKSYKDKSGAWVKTQYLGSDDLLIASELLLQAARWVASQPRREKTDEPVVTNPETEEIPF